MNVFDNLLAWSVQLVPAVTLRRARAFAIVVFGWSQPIPASPLGSDPDVFPRSGRLPELTPPLDGTHLRGSLWWCDRCRCVRKRYVCLRAGVMVRFAAE